MNNSLIEKLVEDIKSAANPQKIILISQKTNNSGEVSSLKIALIVDNIHSTGELESKLYMDIDCEVPFSLVIYRQEKWAELADDELSFAHSISKNGVVLYEQKQ